MDGTIVLAVAATLLGQVARPDSDPSIPTPSPRVAFEVRDLDLDDFGWRGVIAGRSRRLAWEAGITAWEIDAAVASDLMAFVSDSEASDATVLPTAVAEAGAPARVLTGAPLSLVVDYDRVADGPPGEAKAVAYHPIIEQIHNGLDATLAASRGPGGRTIAARFEETRLLGSYTGTFRDEVVREAAADRPKLLGLLRRGGDDADPDLVRTGASSLTVTVPVPEISRKHLEGSWAVPDGHSLLISLGARADSRRFGRTVVRERLVLITPRPARPDEAAATPATPPVPVP